MKALPARLEEHRTQAKSDSEGKVFFTIHAMDNRIRSYIQGNNISFEEERDCPECRRPRLKPVVDHAGSRLDTVGFNLVDLEGLENDDGANFELAREDLKLGGTIVSRITDDCMMRIPAKLFLEILDEINISSNLTAEEIRDLKNMPDSSPETISNTAGNATEMSEDARSDVETDSQSTDEP